MTRTCCRTCRLRFEAGYAGDRCCGCERKLERAPASELVGYRLAGRADPGGPAHAIAVSAVLRDPADDA